MHSLDRRAFAGLAALLPLLASARASAANPPVNPTEHMGADAHARLMAIPGLKMHGKEQLAMLLYPGFTALDLVGPHYFFACMMGAKVHLVTTEPTLAPVVSDLGLAIQPTVTLADAPEALDLAFVPGGTIGTLATMKNPAALAWLQKLAARGTRMTSVCTGSLVLAKAGLLKGRRATCHWAGLSELARFGAIPVAERVVHDGPVTTGAGVSAGLDFALAIVGELRGQAYAQALMLQAEYAPQPPFPGGTLATTDPALREAMQAMLQPFATQVRALA
ncbi:DJ-1/PfpI family protein [Sandaracinobacteroides saxicola]|uniref:DJ-1/PfpI family protein n=1 Tax=Sandaracinobacteroides saxicola TaxID=2759707 RepID=A0A7G5ILS9_9SPHN|nr:DJ-1/PfpI family protein [Sandaracinobacteroides saxicola]QMW24321.1 DJ-1/PfpI family protein [Sandaracinobacteroides saxicola]